jgi:hypothetical protein
MYGRAPVASNKRRPVKRISSTTQMLGPKGQITSSINHTQKTTPYLSMSCPCILDPHEWYHSCHAIGDESSRELLTGWLWDHRFAAGSSSGKSARRTDLLEFR